MFSREKKYFIKNDDSCLELEDMSFESDEEYLGRVEYPFNKKLLDVFWYSCLLMLVIMISRVFYLSVIKGGYYRDLSQSNKTRNILIRAPRGKIYDRFGNALVYNIPSLDLAINPNNFSDDANEIAKISELIANILQEDKNEVEKKLLLIKEKAKKSVLLFENITQDQAILVAEKLNNFPSVFIEKTAIRSYVDSIIFSHILGYEGKIKPEELASNPGYLMTDSIGKQGIEKSYEKYLRGQYGARKIEVDSMGRFKKELEIISPIPGNELMLNINSELQKRIFDSLTSILEKEDLKVASAVAMDPRNGEVLALVSIPSFDNNLFSGGISVENYERIINDPLKPMFNRVVLGEYPPGSTIKPLIAAAALKEGVITNRTQIESKGGIAVGEYYFGDWKIHGITDVRRAIAVSSDVFFYSIGGGYGGIEGLGMSRMKKYEEMFGLGEKTGIDISNEETGFIPDEQWKLEETGEKWYKGNSYHAAIGQGYITTTPIQLANYICAIANDGTLYQPRIVSQVRSFDGKTLNNKPIIKRENIIDKSILKVVQEGMRMTVTEGTAQLLNELKVKVAGKTGTAQYGNESKTFGWFVSYAPYDNPEIVLVVLIEGQDSENSYNAVPVTKEVYQWYFNEEPKEENVETE
ncbi:MAG: penicillin-binding protein 2 [Candidatus Moranbacteria bacterium]|nr:penicillin-binding protein 2 [Candidatus Moranbacteria bacterium]